MTEGIQSFPLMLSNANHDKNYRIKLMCCVCVTLMLIQLLKNYTLKSSKIIEEKRDIVTKSRFFNKIPSCDIENQNKNCSVVKVLWRCFTWH